VKDGVILERNSAVGARMPSGTAGMGTTGSSDTKPQHAAPGAFGGLFLRMETKGRSVAVCVYV